MRKGFKKDTIFESDHNFGSVHNFGKRTPFLMIRNHIKVLGINLNAQHVNEMTHFEFAIQSVKLVRIISKVIRYSRVVIRTKDLLVI